METGDGDPILIAGYDAVPRCGHGASGGEAATEEQRHGRGSLRQILTLGTGAFLL